MKYLILIHLVKRVWFMSSLVVLFLLHQGNKLENIFQIFLYLKLTEVCFFVCYVDDTECQKLGKSE